MATPDFTYKPDATIISAFQNAQQMKMQQEEMERKKQMDSFNLAVDTSKAIGGLVSSFVQAAEERKTNKLMDQAKSLIAEKGATQIPTAGPVQEGAPALPTGPDPRSVAQRKLALDLMQKTNPKEFSSRVGDLVFGDNSTQAKRFQQGTAEVDGVPISLVFDTQTGDFLDNDKNVIKGKIIRGFKPTVTTDPTTQELVSVGAAGKAKPIASTSDKSEILDPLDLNVRQSNRLDELKKQFIDDDLVKANRLTLNTINNLKTVQAEGTGALIGSLQSLRARAIAGEKGVLTEQDVLRTTGSPALTRRFMNAFTKLAKGEENPDNLREFDSAIAAVEKAAVNRNKKIEADYIKRAKSTKELRNVSEDLIRSNISIGTEEFEAPAPKTPSITSIDEARKLTPEQRRARIAELEAQRSK